MANRKLSGAEREYQKKNTRYLQTQMARACDRYLALLKEHPPGLLCWLRGGINTKKANELKDRIEGRGSRIEEKA